MSDETKPQQGKLAYGVEEAFKLLSIGRTHGFELLRNGELPSVKIGRRRVIPAAALHTYLERLVKEQCGGSAA